MIIYLDTSALVKKYFQEEKSSDVLDLWQKASEIITSSVSYAESMATFYRKRREKELTDPDFEHLLDNFRKDFMSMIRVNVTEDLNRWIDSIMKRHPLRGFDAVHLASAVMIQERVADPILFACFDQRLVEAAKREGLSTFP